MSVIPGEAHFEDPRFDESVPYDSMLERFRAVRDEIEWKIRDWLENPEAELAKLKEEREQERRERIEAARREAEQEAGREARSEALSARPVTLGSAPTALSYTPPVGAPWDAIQAAAQGWQRTVRELAPA